MFLCCFKFLKFLGVGQSKSTKLGLGHSVPISNATKKSFQGNRDLSDSNPDIAASTARYVIVTVGELFNKKVLFCLGHDFWA